MRQIAHVRRQLQFGAVTRPADRAVAVVLDGDKLLVMRRHKHGEDYCVLPGGGVEPGEEPVDASIRELREETGLQGVAARHLWTIAHQDRTARYFRVTVEAGPMIVDGPEALVQSDQNRYSPEWVSVEHLADENLKPEAVQGLLSALLASKPPACS